MKKRKNAKFILDADLITLRAVVAVVDEGSFSGAAKKIERTQSAVSLQIAKLEERMVIRLFERTSRSVGLTPAGEVFTAYARRILGLSDEAYAAVSSPIIRNPLASASPSTWFPIICTSCFHDSSGDIPKLQLNSNWAWEGRL